MTCQLTFATKRLWRSQLASPFPLKICWRCWHFHRLMGPSWRVRTMPRTMPKMTKEGETRLRSALDAVVDLVNDGEAPDDAIVKVASEHAIPPGHVGLMVHAYNTGRTTRHRESHSSLLDKAADFPIAD